MDEEKEEPDHRISLRRNLGLLDGVLLGVGAIVGGGIFTLTGLVASYAGSALPLVILINASIAITTALAYAELSSAFPSAGGGYKWIREAFGPLVGHLSGWASWFAQSVVCALYALSFGYYALEIWFAYVLPFFGIAAQAPGTDIAKKGIAIAVIVLFGAFNFRSVAGGRRVGNLITLVEIGVILFFIVTGVIAFLHNPYAAQNLSIDLPHGIFGLFAGAGIMYIAFEGSEIVAQSGEELKAPSRNLPQAILISFLLVVAMYIGVMFVALGGITAEIPAWQVLANAGEGALVQAARYFSPLGAMILTFGGALAGLAAMNATIYSSSHVSFAMGREGQLPRAFGRTHAARKTPDWALGASLALIITMATFLPLKEVASVADLLFIFLFLQLQLTLIQLRRKRPEVPRSFKVPLYPALQVAAIIGYLLIGIQFLHVSPLGVLITGAWMALGFVVYKKIARPNYKEDFIKHTPLEEHLRSAGTEWRYRIVVPLLENINPQTKTFRIQLAAAMAKRHLPATIYVVRVHSIPQSRAINSVTNQELAGEISFIRKIAAKFQRSTPDSVDTVDRIYVGYEGHEAESILDVVEHLNADLLLLGWRGWTKTRGNRFGSTIDPILHRHSCDLIIVKGSDYVRAKKIVLPSGGGAHARFAASVASALAKEKRGPVVAFTVAHPSLSDEEKSEKMNAALTDFHWPHDVPLTHEVVVGENVTDAVMERASDADVIVLAASRGRMFKEFLLGNTPETVARQTDKTVLIVKHHADIDIPFWEYIKRRFI